MSIAARALPLAIVLVSFTVCGVMLWFKSDALRWVHIVLLAVAFAILSGPERTSIRRAVRGLAIGLATSVVLVAIVLSAAWTRDRSHFFDDGGPLAGLLVIEFGFGLPAALIGAVFSGLAGPALDAAAKFKTGQPV